LRDSELDSFSECLKTLYAEHWGSAVRGPLHDDPRTADRTEPSARSSRASPGDGAAREQRASWAGGPRPKPCDGGVESRRPTIFVPSWVRASSAGISPFHRCCRRCPAHCCRPCAAPRRAIGGEDSSLISWKQHVLSDHSRRFWACVGRRR